MYSLSFKLRMIRGVRMLKGLSKAGLGEVDDVEELVDVASINNFAAIETSGKELKDYVDANGLEDVKLYFQNKNIQISALSLPVEWRMSDEKFRKGIQCLVEEVELAAEFGCKTFFTYFLPSTNQDVAPYMIRLTNRLKLIAKILQEYHMNLALEFVAPHHLRTAWQYPFIWDAKTTSAWIDMIGESNVGILLDSFHWYTSGGTVADILAMQNNQIAYVHLNDARDIPVEHVLDNDRLFPGEGVIDLVGFLKALKGINYQGFITQEILTPQEPEESSEYLAKKSGTAFAELYRKAGLE